MIDFKSVVDRKAIHYIQMIDGLCIENSNARYRFVDQIAYQRILAADPIKGMRIY